MGIAPLQSIFSSWFSKKGIRILLLGCDNAGKTTILYKLKLGEVVSTVPTIGFNLERVENKNISITSWDIGGVDKIRALWRPYQAGTQGIIFVIDTTDKDRIDHAVIELKRLMVDEELKDACLLVLANKSDIAQISIEELTQVLDLQNLKRDWFIQRTCAITGEGLYEGLDWLLQLCQKSKQ